MPFRDQIVSRDQLGHFWKVLNFVGISPNLRVVYWNLSFFFLKNKCGYSANKTTLLEPSFQIIFLIPKLPPMWPPLLLNFPIAFILSYIYLLLFLRFSKFTMLLSSQFFKLSTLSSSLFSILLSLEVKDDIFGIIDFF